MLDFKVPQITQRQDGCTVVVERTIIVDASHSPTTAHTAVAIAVSG